MRMRPVFPRPGRVERSLPDGAASARGLADLPEGRRLGTVRAESVEPAELERSGAGGER